MNPLFRSRLLRRPVLILENFFFNLFYIKKLGNRIKIFGYPLLKIECGSKIIFGQRVIMISDEYFSEPGINHLCIIRVGKNAKLKIGDDVGMSGVTICVQNEVSIGNQVLLGSNVLITDSDFHPIESQNRRYATLTVAHKVVISDNVFIGMNVMILKGVTIGCNSIIGAGSIVTKDIPENVIAAGVPAKIIGNLTNYEDIKIQNEN